MLKLLAFDIVNTLGRIDNLNKEHLHRYQLDIKRNLRLWSPFYFHKDWTEIPPFEDVLSGIERLRKNFRVVTFSNMPAWCQMELLRNWNLTVDGITPLELYEMSKPSRSAYLATRLWDYPYEEIALITANRTFGDLEGAAAWGMTGICIRDEESPFQTLHDLADYLEQTQLPKPTEGENKDAIHP